MYLHSVEGATNYYPMDVVTPDGSLITCSEGVHRSRVELGLDRLVAFAMSYSSDEGSLTVCSSHSSENYWNMVEPRFQPLRGRGHFPASNLCLRSGLSVSARCVFHRCSLSFAGVISRKRHGLHPGRTRVTQKRLCRRCRALAEPA